MIRKKLEDISLGMVLAQPVLGIKGVNLIAEGTILTTEHLTKLGQWGIDSVLIAEPEDLLTSEEQEEKERQTRQIYQKTYTKAINCTKDVLQNVIAHKPLKTEEVKSSVQEMIDKVMENHNVFLQLTQLNIWESHLFTHSVNVCAYALLVGIYLKLTGEQLLDLGTAALLHDIGMMKIEESLWNHNQPLGEDGWQAVKAHPLLGAEIVEKLANYPQAVIEGVKQHHERRDGSGYPQGLKGEAINFYAEIIGIVNIYDSLTSARKYRSSVTPNEAMKIILGGGENHFLPQISRAFVAYLAIYPIGSLVLLNSGEIAQVMGVTPNYPFRPRLKILFTEEHKPQSKLKRLDLRSKKFDNIYIAKSLNQTEVNDLVGKH